MIGPRSVAVIGSVLAALGCGGPAQDGGDAIKHALLFHRPMQLPAAKQTESDSERKREGPADRQPLHAATIRIADNGGLDNPWAVFMSSSLQKLVIIAFLVVILWNLGAALYYMMIDKGSTDRTVKSLTWRIGVSVSLILLVALGLFTGVLKGHGIYQ